MFQFHTATHVMILGSSLDEQKIYRHDLPLNKSNSCSKNIRCNPLKNHIACNAFITSSLSLSLFDLIIVFTVSCEPTHLKTCIWENWNGLILLVIPNESRCRFMQNFCEREGSCGGLILVEYLLCIFLVSFWSWCTYAAANVISFGCLFSSCPSSCCLLYLCCLLAGYVLSLLFFLSFIFWKITTVKIFQKITTIKSSRRLVMWRACAVILVVLPHVTC